MNRRVPVLLSLLALHVTACVEPDDDPSQVHDLRVLAVALDTPELMAPSCEPTEATAAALAQEVELRALVVDPRDGAGELAWSLTACVDEEDRECLREGERVPVADGRVAPGEDVVVRLRPGALVLPSGTPLLAAVQQRDPYKGLGGVRMPLVLHVRRGAEEIYAQKRMVFSCPRADGMAPNLNPVVPALSALGAPWAQDVVPELAGPGPFLLGAEDASALEEPYVVVGLDLAPIALKESWKIAWHVSAGKMSREETGGADFGGQQGRHESEWEPPEGGVAQELTFWAVVRDGRGGSAWAVRRARWTP